VSPLARERSPKFQVYRSIVSFPKTYTSNGVPLQTSAGTITESIFGFGEIEIVLIIVQELGFTV
jgi:hypothetical protein